MTTYSWIITHDHLSTKHDSDYAVGITGPSNAPADLLERLQNGEGRTFRLYDDDQELYYTGRGLWDGEDTENAAYGPLGDFGASYAGCTQIKWHNRPDLNCA